MLHGRKKHTAGGFTIVELLVVIVVIAILAAISVVAYTGIQQRARDSRRAQDVRVITQALEMYFADNGKYPPGSCTASCAINPSWSNTNDGSWANLKNALVPKYISDFPSEPRVMTGDPLGTGVYGYAYFSNTSGTYCGAPAGQMYILVYTLESGAQKNTLTGSCTTNQLGPYPGKSNYRVAIGGS